MHGRRAHARLPENPVEGRCLLARDLDVVDVTPFVIAIRVRTEANLQGGVVVGAGAECDGLVGPRGRIDLLDGYPGGSGPVLDKKVLARVGNGEGNSRVI